MCSREDIRKKRIEEEVRKKVDSEKRAHEIVTSLLETNIQENYFVKSVAMVTESHYKDVTEERAILRICGFALCDNQLKNVPKQKYKIHRNKVFDLEIRKHFCSELCYKKSNNVKRQIPGLPMWLRDENTTEAIHLTSKNERGLEDDEINLVPKLSLDNVETLGFKNNESDSFEDLPTFSTGVNKTESVKFEKVIEIKPTSRKISDTVKDSVLEIIKSWLTADSRNLLNPISNQAKIDFIKHEKLKRLHENLNKVVMGSGFDENEQQEKKAKNENLKLERKGNEVYMERVERFYQGGFDLKHKAKSKPVGEDREIVESILPEVDSKDQVNIRRRILTEKLLKVIQDLVPTLPNPTVFDPIKSLVRTFNISNKNVKLKTHEYPITGIYILILLCKGFTEIKEYFKQSEANFEIILETYNTSVTELNYEIEELFKLKTVQ